MIFREHADNCNCLLRILLTTTTYYIMVTTWREKNILVEDGDPKSFVLGWSHLGKQSFVNSVAKYI